jgi:eukaryotic-like serine/threonine-protein kinase
VVLPPGTGGDKLLGTTLGGYVLEAKIGSGATGVVYRARRRGEDRPVAIKVLNENLGQISSLRRRFEREARALSRLAHPRIVHISDFGITPEATFIAMEVLEGDTLEEILADGPIAPESAVAIMMQALEGVAFAHELQIVHRDLKPANVFLQYKGGGPDVKVLDFGLAKFLSVDELSEDATLTRRGRIVGTPAYMAPEQITGGALDVRADVYAAGVMLFELLADRRPFDYPRRSQLLRAHLFEPVPSLASIRPALTVHPELEAVVGKALSKDPGRRFANAQAMLDALAAVPEGSVHLAGGPVPRSHRRVGSTSEVISESDRRAATTGLERGVTESNEGVSVPTASARSLPPLETLVDRLPLGSLPPQSAASPAHESERRARLLWWAAGTVLSVASGFAGYYVVRVMV